MRAGQQIESEGVLSCFDEFAKEYDAWFDQEGKLIFFIEAQAFRPLLPSLPKPWLEIGVGSGRFAQALGIGTGIDPSLGLVRMAKKRGVNAFVSRGEQKVFDEESFGTVFLIVTSPIPPISALEVTAKFSSGTFTPLEEH